MARMIGSTKGKLLVATPPLGDPNFDRSVVFMLEHNEEGAVGVVLNRPLDEMSIDGLEAWFALTAPPAVVFGGGPVEPDALIAVAHTDPADVNAADDDDDWSHITREIGTLDLRGDPDDTAGQLQALRIFRGYSGWGAFQLEQELSAGAWIVLPAEHQDLFTATPAVLWRQVLRRQGGRLAWIADAPDDLSSN